MRLLYIVRYCNLLQEMLEEGIENLNEEKSMIGSTKMIRVLFESLFQAVDQ